MSDDRQAIYRFDRNLVVQAGAGTGKTYNLVKLYVHLLAGLTQRPTRFAPEDIVCVTFTDKAAQEMKGRIREKIAELRENPDGDADLNRAAERLARPLPDRRHWDQMRLQMSSAFVGTFHSYCGQILRERALSAGLDPRFRLLAAAEESADLLEAVSKEAVLSETQAQGHAWEAVYRYGLTQTSPIGGSGVVEHIGRLVNKLREADLDASTFRAPQYEASRLHDLYQRALHTYIQHLETLAEGRHGLKSKSAAFKRLDKLAHHLRENAGVITAIPLSAFTADHEAIAAVGEILHRARLGDLKAHKTDAEDTLAEIQALATTLEAQSVIQSFEALVGTARTAYEQRKTEMGALDFGDLIIKARNLLRDHPEIRQKAKMRLRILMVDEFQDTNQTQKDLVYLLGEKRGQEKAIDPLVPIEKQVQLEPATLFVVGDRKQSIYGFRGADVSVFNQTLGEISSGRLANESPSRPLSLQACRRSTPGLIAGTNCIFGHIMGGAETPQFALFDSPFDAELDALTPFRQSVKETPDMTLISFTEPTEDEAKPKSPTGEAAVTLQAKALALRLKAMVEGGDFLVREKTVNDDGPLRPVRYGDIAILLRRFSNLQVFLRELILKDIPHAVIRGQGFYGAQEIQDLVNILRLITAPSADIALLATLRSPMVNLSDTSIAALSLASAPTKLRFKTLLGHLKSPKPFAHIKGLTPGDRERLVAFLHAYKRLRAQADRLGAHGLSKAIIDVTHFDITLAGTFQGDQKVANLEKFLSMAKAFDAEPSGGLPSFVRRMTRSLEAQPREANASLFGESEDVIQVMTIHQSKGLEYPVVCIPECHARPPMNREAVLFHPKEGLGLRLSHPDPRQKGQATLAHSRIKTERNARELAESKRIFYVAVTRARDHLMLLGDHSQKNCWRDWIEQARGELESNALLEVVDGRELLKSDTKLPLHPPLSSEAVATMAQDNATTESGEDLRAAIRAQLLSVQPPAPERVRVRRMVAPVTQLDDFQLCPRRYHFWHELNLEEFPNLRGNKPTIEAEAPQEEETGAKLDPLRRGTLAHHLLEVVDLERYAHEKGAILTEMLIDDGYDLEDAQVLSVQDDVIALLESPFGQGMQALPPQQIHREWPFILPITTASGMTLFVSGKLDLLIEGEDGAYRVIDYKHTFRQDRSAEDYRFQLMAYALAATQLLGATTVEAEIVFLRDREHPWQNSPMTLSPTPAELEAFRLELGQLGRRLAQDRLSLSFTKSKLDHCLKVKCGYVWRCYPQEMFLGEKRN